MTAFTVKIERLWDSNFDTRKQEKSIVLAFHDLNQYTEEGGPKNDAPKRAYNRGKRKAQAWICLALSQKQLKHVSDAFSDREMWNTILNIFERHALRNTLHERQKLYIGTKQFGEKVLSSVGWLKELTRPLRSMDIEIDDKERAMAVLDRHAPSFENLILGLDALEN